MEAMIFKRDDLKLGIILGILGPALGLVVIYFLNYSAFSFGELYLKNAEPWTSFAPPWETTLTCAPELRPSSAEYVADSTRTSLTDSWFGVTSADPPQLKLLTLTPSIM